MSEFKEPNISPTDRGESNEAEQQLINEAVKKITEGDWSVLENSELGQQEIALKLIEAEEGVLLVINLNRFKRLDYQEIALKLIEAGLGSAIVRNIDKCPAKDHQEIILKLFDDDRTDNGYIIKNLINFKMLGEKTALKMIEIEQGNMIPHRLYNFEGLDLLKIALKLIEAGEVAEVAQGIKGFPDKDHKEIALKIMEAGQGDEIALNFYKFRGLDSETAQDIKGRFSRLGITEH
ncbi:hypothetical protein K8R42_03100 [bacterium]|nr:hypothetical protein [bacterium]